MATDTNYGTTDDANRATLEIDRSTSLPTPSAPWNTVINRFDSTLALTNTMLSLLIGADGASGYLGVLADFLEDSAPVTSISIDDVDTSMTVANVKSPPVFNKNDFDTFPDFTAPDPDLVTIPTVDVSSLYPPDEPTDINPTISWSEINLNNDIYQQLLTRISDDLVYGATGLTTEIQEDIFNAGLDRQRRENDKAYQRVNNDIAGRGSTLPTGALLAAIGEISAEILVQNSNINRTITIEQAELAQKNSQFIIDQARMLETLLRDTRDKESNRSLDYEKAVAALVIQVYVEKVKMYIAIAEANKMYVEAQVANLQAVTAYNMALIDQYKAILQAYGIQVETISSKNTSLADIYKAEIAGYESETTAISRTDMTKIEKLKLDIANAQIQLDEQIASASSTLNGYTTEANLREKISNDLSNIANQAMVGALSSVNANASLGYSGGESKSETWSHQDSLSEGHTYNHMPNDDA